MSTTALDKLVLASGPVSEAADRLLAGHADRLAGDERDVAAGHEEPDAVRPHRQANPLLELEEQGFQLVADEDVGVDEERCLIGDTEAVEDRSPGPTDELEQTRPFASAGGGVGGEHELPVDAELLGSSLEAVDNNLLDVDPRHREPGRKLLGRAVVVSRGDDELEEGALLEGVLEPAFKLLRRCLRGGGWNERELG